MSNPDIANTRTLYNDPNYKKWQGDALQEGIKMLLEFGGWDTKNKMPKISTNDSYLDCLRNVLKRIKNDFGF